MARAGLGLAFPEDEASADPNIGLGLSEPVRRAAEIKAAVTQPRGYRNNNPLNIEAGSFTQGQPGFAGSDGRFARFESMEAGINAADSLLQSYANRGLTTVNDIINRWAPPTENNTGAYAGYVSDKLGVTPDTKLDMENPNTRARLIGAMGEFENGGKIPTETASAPSSDTTIDLSAARKKVLEAPTSRNNGVPQFDTDPIGAIGTVMQEVGLALQGKPGVIDKMKEQALQQRMLDLKMAQGFLGFVAQAQKLSELPKDKQEEGAAILNRIAKPVFGNIDVSAFISNKSVDWKALTATLTGLSDESKVTLLNIAKANGGNTKAAIEVLTNKDLISGLQKADDARNTPSIMQKGTLWTGALTKAGIPLDKVTLPQLEAANEKLPESIRFSATELETIKRNPGIQRSLGLTTETEAATKEKAAAEAAGKAEVTPQTEVAKINADFKAGRITAAQRDAAITKATTAPGTNITVNTSAQQDLVTKGLIESDIKTVGEFDSANREQASLVPQLDLIIGGLEGGVETGRLKELTRPIRQIAQGAGWNDDPKLPAEETVASAMAYLIPRLRVKGSGSTSDMEINLFTQAVPNFKNTTRGNIIIAHTYKQIIGRNRDEAKLMREYLRDNRNLDGVGKFIDDKLGPLFPQPSSKDEYDAIPKGTVYIHPQNGFSVKK